MSLILVLARAPETEDNEPPYFDSAQTVIGGFQNLADLTITEPTRLSLTLITVAKDDK